MNDDLRPSFWVRLNRRRWLALSLAGGLVGQGRGAEPAAEALREDDARAVAEIRRRARRLDLGEFRVSLSRRYLAIGDASATYRTGALRLCEDLAAAFLAHFASKGFALNPPSRRLTIVTLADAVSYGRFSRDARPGPYGMYDGNSDRLMVYDLRGREDLRSQRAEVLNRRVLVHEAQHQLAFHSGLLRDSRTDHLRSLVEGLAIYGESYRAGEPATLGAIDHDRLQYLAERLRQGARWLSAESLLADNSVFATPSEASICQAYAQSWLLVHHLLSEPALLPRCRDYLAAYNRSDPARRLDLARRHLGNLNQLDQAARKQAGL